MGFLEFRTSGESATVPPPCQGFKAIVAYEDAPLACHEEQSAGSTLVRWTLRRGAFHGVHRKRRKLIGNCFLVVERRHTLPLKLNELTLNSGVIVSRAVGHSRRIPQDFLQVLGLGIFNEIRLDGGPSISF